MRETLLPAGRVAVLIVGISWASVALAANPYGFTVTVAYIEKDVKYVFDSPEAPACAYVAGEAPWCTHTTSQNGEYTHAHMPEQFPINRSFPDPNGSGKTIQHDVTVAKSDLYWNVPFPFPTYKMQLSSTTVKDCHGFATGKDHVVQANDSGIGRVRTDDYTRASQPVVNSISSTNAHSIKITAIYSQVGCGTTKRDTVQTTQEKFSSGPVYERTYESPGKDFSNLYNPK
jgi:hypothetical protein